MQKYSNRLDDHMELDAEDFNFDQSECSICHKSFKMEESRVRDHCHLCAKGRGIAHVDCNLTYRLKREIVVILHNLRRYDSHLIMQEIGKVCNEKDLRLDCLARGMEDYLSFSIRNQRPHKDTKVWKIKFKDSCLFLPSSLEDLVKTIPQDSFCAVKTIFGENDSLLMMRKGVFPYDYFNNPSVLDETMLPSKESFTSKLTGEPISEEDYKHAQTVWNSFQMDTFRDYHNLYLMLDVLLLADVFTAFRNLAMEHYGLDPAHYITLPSLAWDACMRLADAKLDSIFDPDMYSFLEKGKRGGIAVISHRNAVANNPYIKESYDPSSPSTHIIYVDANNLYGWAMMQSLPIGNFAWMTHEEISEIDWSSVCDNNTEGFILEVDLEYPAELHVLHNDYPLAPESMLIQPDMLSPYCQELRSELQLGNNSVQKLAPNLNDKIHYVLHYQNLKLYLEHGLKLKTVHRAIKFTQGPWMKPYIMLNTTLRSQAKTSFEKDLFKLMNNSVFGKSIENVRKYVDLKLVTKEEIFIKLAANPRYKRSSIFNDKLVGVNLKKPRMSLDKPIYVGISILDVFKTLMYRYHYNYMVPEYGARAKLLFTDTDSFAYHVQTEDIYNDMGKRIDLFDTSEYPENHSLYSIVNKKALGKFKDETKGVPVKSFVGLRAKMYSFQCGTEEKKRAKGVKRKTVEKEISHADYVAALKQRKSYRHTMNMFRNDLHQIYTVSQNKITLSPFDDKRYILEDGITTLAYGHCHIKLDRGLQLSDEIMHE